jgi:hypothetical protein
VADSLDKAKAVFRVAWDANGKPMAKKPLRERLAGTKAPVRWRISLLNGTLAKFLGYVEAPDEKAAIEAAVKEFKIARPLPDRIVAQRD